MSKIAPHNILGPAASARMIIERTSDEHVVLDVEVVARAWGPPSAT
ncbi:MAG: hypothetical protein HRU31_08955 [Rhodobacteraceae bacterium]|nr:hypothetical protein [Paracoccaceae bacterium]